MPDQAMYKFSEEEFFLHIPARERCSATVTFKAMGITGAFYGYAGNFTVVLLERSIGPGKFIGVAKRNPVDIYKGEVALDIACVRALRALNNEDPGYERQRPVSKREAKMASNIACLTEVFNAVAEKKRRR